MATNAPNEEEQPSAASFELEVGETAPLEPDSVRPPAWRRPVNFD
jgi:hypothetical protein